MKAREGKRGRGRGREERGQERERAKRGGRRETRSGRGEEREGQRQRTILLSLEASGSQDTELPGSQPTRRAHPEGGGTHSCSGPAGTLGMAVTFLSVSFPIWKRGQSSPCGRVRGSPT